MCLFWRSNYGLSLRALWPPHRKNFLAEMLPTLLSHPVLEEWYDYTGWGVVVFFTPLRALWRVRIMQHTSQLFNIFIVFIQIRLHFIFSLAHSHIRLATEPSFLRKENKNCPRSEDFKISFLAILLAQWVLKGCLKSLFNCKTATIPTSYIKHFTNFWVKALQNSKKMLYFLYVNFRFTVPGKYVLLI